MRQFMNGMKNYLVKHGEKDFKSEVEKACATLKPDQFINLDHILEGVMHQLVILPLREHLYDLFVDYYGSRGDIELIIANMKFAEDKDQTAFGVKVSLKMFPAAAAGVGGGKVVESPQKWMIKRRTRIGFGGAVDMETHAIDSQFVNLPIVEIFRNCVYTHTLRE